MQDAKEEVRSRLNIEEVIGEYIKLQRAGRSFKGLSPFTQEKTPSFMVSPEKHVWYDFSGNRGGDIFTFIMEIEGLDFRGALELLARKAGVDLSLYQTKGSGVAAKKKRLLGILELATQYYQQTLLKNQRALEYVFKTRGLQKETVTNFGIGFAPDSRDALVVFLRKKGFSPTDVKEAGLSNSKGGDLFRSRMIVPLQDISGQVIGFTGRLIGEDKYAPKYLNTPQTLLYDKSHHVFGLSQAKESIRKTDKVVMVEGNLDVVSSHQAGVKNVVAAAGTALTIDHLRTLKRLTSHIILAFDSDRAGIAATERAIPMTQSLDLDLKIIRLPEGAKDPDELIQRSPEAWAQIINEAEPVVDWVLHEYEKRYDIATAEGKRQYSSAGLNVVKSLKDDIEKDHYMHIIAQKTGTRLEAVEKKLLSTETSPEVPLKKTNIQKERESDEYAHQDTLLSLAVFDPEVRGLLIDLESLDLFNDQAAELLTYLKTHNEIKITEDIPPELQEIETYVKILLLRADAKYAEWSALDRYDETAKLVRLIKNETKQQIKRQLQEELRRAEEMHDETEVKRLRESLNNLIKEMG